MLFLFQHVKPPKIDYEPRRKRKGKGGSAKVAQIKKIVQETARRVCTKHLYEYKWQLINFCFRNSLKTKKAILCRR